MVLDRGGSQLGILIPGHCCSQSAMTHAMRRFCLGEEEPFQMGKESMKKGPQSRITLMFLKDLWNGCIGKSWEVSLSKRGRAPLTGSIMHLFIIISVLKCLQNSTFIILCPASGRLASFYTNVVLYNGSELECIQLIIITVIYKGLAVWAWQSVLSIYHLMIPSK